MKVLHTLFLLSIVFCISILTSCSSTKYINNSPSKNGSEKRSVKKNKNQILLTRYAERMNVPLKQVNNIALYTFIDQWMGAPYRLGGTTKAGIDCSAFTGLLYKNVYNRALPRTTKAIAAKLRHKRKHKLKEGNLVFLNFGGGRYSHVGVYLQNGWFVHTSTSKGVMLSSLNQHAYKRAYTKGGVIQ